MMILLVFLSGPRAQLSQSFYSTLYALCLIGLFLCVVLVWKARYMINQTWAPLHKHFSTAVAKTCVEDKGWRNVLELFNTHTDFGTSGQYLTYMVWFFVGMLLVGVVFAIWALMKIANLQQQSVVYAQ